MSPALDCRVERGPVVIRVDGAVLPPATVQPELPGSEYVRLFDVVHAAVLHWSPNVMAATAGLSLGCPATSRTVRSRTPSTPSPTVSWPTGRSWRPRPGSTRRSSTR